MSGGVNWSLGFSSDESIASWADPSVFSVLPFGNDLLMELSVGRHSRV